MSLLPINSSLKGPFFCDCDSLSGITFCDWAAVAGAGRGQNFPLQPSEVLTSVIYFDIRAVMSVCWEQLGPAQDLEAMHLCGRHRAR